MRCEFDKTNDSPRSRSSDQFFEIAFFRLKQASISMFPFGYWFVYKHYLAILYLYWYMVVMSYMLRIYAETA